ncbi:hypothetical protein [Bradyrhizobium sp. CCBAU 53421]|uniref:hypothetical protein n=1 Tax=Bradyrhizobium sp. CCBAU 53421 TaxID=1325120 RepID=UPI00188B923F|nr:hypothetical protein [Bradyrhizobium sp. CCBAU 53421]QOZ33966.1 hypothetical protein XH92_21780 [Bradyrhizobium sp. CCBAU 53421]
MDTIPYPTHAVVARLDRAIQYSRDVSESLRSRGVLGPPAKPGDDSGGAALSADELARRRREFDAQKEIAKGLRVA